MKAQNLDGGRLLRSVLTALLCAAFFLLAMGLVLLGSSIYGNVSETSEENYAYRTAINYLVNQVWRVDVEGGVSVGTFGESDALFLTEYGYTTVLYCVNGSLCELFAEDVSVFSPNDGTAVLALDALELEAEDGLLTICATTSAGEQCVTAIAPRCGLTEEGTP